MKLNVLLLLFILLCATNTVKSQTISPVTMNTATTIFVKTLDDTSKIEFIKDVLLEFNSSKIVAVTYSYANKSYTVSHTNQFNLIETLGLIRTYGYEGYTVKGTKALRLNGMGTALVETINNSSE